MTSYELKRVTTIQTILEEILDSTNVYFSPPQGMMFNYPCIVYEKTSIPAVHADDIKYEKFTRYTVTLIDPDPDSDLPDKILELPYCSHDQRFVSDRLVHDVFTLYMR